MPGFAARHDVWTHMENIFTDEEREQMRKMAALQKTAWQIVLKWKTLFISMFLGLSALFSTYIVWHLATSNHRYTATTRLSYIPRKVSRVENLSDKQLHTVLERPSLKRRVGQMLAMTRSEKECLTVDLRLKQERHPSNIFTLTAQAPSQIGAVTKVNAYAKILIAEYMKYREHDLDNLRDSINLRKDRLQEQIAAFDSEETILKGKAGVASPVETLTTLNGLLSDQRRNLSLLKVQTMNEEVRQQHLEETVGKFGPAIKGNTAFIREKNAQLAALDAEIAQLRELYTDINPKLRGKLEDRQAIVDEYTAMLKDNGIEGLSLDDFAQIEKAAAELLEVRLRLDVLAESARSLNEEIKSNEGRSAALTTIIPSIERIRSKRGDLERTMSDLDDQLGEIDYLRMAMSGDLRQIERSGGAGDASPLQSKNFVYAIAAAFACTLTAMFWILALELLFGKISGSRELAANDDVAILGSLPRPSALPEQEEKDIMGVVALNLCKAELPKGVVFICRLPGVPPQDAFMSSIDWSLSMAGKRSFVLEIVKSGGFEPPEGAEPIIAAFRKHEKGWFPVENRFMLVPSELEMLQADIASLKADFDVIFITVTEGTRRGGSFFSQILSVSDSVLIMAGAGATPRAWVAYARRMANEAGKPMMGVITNATAKAVKKEMEEFNA